MTLIPLPACICVTSLPYADILTGHYIVMGQLHPVAQQISDLLRGVLWHYLHRGQFTMEVRQRAELHLHKFAALAQRVNAISSNCCVCGPAF
jgi:hypothetical protein